LFTLTGPATVGIDIVQTDTVSADPEQSQLHSIDSVAPKSFRAGPGEIVWTPTQATAPRSYVLELIVTAPDGSRRVYAVGKPGAKPLAPVVRVQGIDAGFPDPSFAPGQLAEVNVATDARRLTFQVFAYSGGAFPTDRDQRTNSEAMTSAAQVDWSAHRNAPASIRIVRPGNWPSGLYFLRISADDGRVGYAPFVLRPKKLGQHRVAVVLATQTWQAYNLEDANGDGWGDSWYTSGGAQHWVDLTRPFRDFGLPYRFGDWDLAFLTWLQQNGKQVDFLTDEDLNTIARGDQLAVAYSLVIFPGHEEYVTAHELAVIQRYKTLGGNMAFLASNNLFWKVQIDGTKMEKVALWRNSGTPEASIVGAQYAGSNHGAVQAPYVVTGATKAPWLFAGTGLSDGSSFGSYGIEIDATTPQSPLGTIVLATIPNLLGPGKSAEMTYYETAAGARVFDAGALDFAASANDQPVSALLQNLWTRLSLP
ncbi:MAG TPA: N,N-dimethylformamidase beta subunit family domain-containing protein, partial [Gaiellaceae bacterium]|nr:N,N-dimethylformamidase beta subunit family domain-containing protein [Gaiellaceae bacterium]